MPRFITTKDPVTFFSGCRDWEFNNGGSYEGLCRFAWFLDDSPSLEDFDDEEFKNAVIDQYLSSLEDRHAL